ncbi:pentatricopeptide repeat-containing protein At4g02750 [Selaginella moellendorffii]|uniref:pentatricopeptide repeat-containing protein At4g02750 n=1 Tax=Selaginella moellendorffii TaxID=88036 RepID=UPI000D1CE4C6|nr:pentatricopeptide repeat-containing protein At4g02750 [Selaginella moellendorffii]|eukprot:XP_024532807.1 pentatricopeptide repeat-containing protein At4g02750 [Selaginella moellendorffii]
MAFFSSSGSHHLSKLVFDDIPERDLVSWNVFLNGYAAGGHTQGSLDTFHRMPQWSVVSWTTLVTSFLQNPSSYTEARSLFDRAPERNSVLWNAMVGTYAQSGHIVEAKALFDRMPLHDLVSWNSLLAGYKEEGDRERAVDLFRSMPERNVMSWNTMIALDPLQGKEFFARMAMWSLASCSAILQAYAAHGEMREAREFFDAMPQRDALAWTCLLSGYAWLGHSTAAKNTLDRMPAWDVVSCTAMIHGHVLALDHAAAKEIFDSMPERNALSWNTLLQSAAQHSSSSCRSIAGRMPCHNAVSWSIQLASLAQRGAIDATRHEFNSLVEGDPVSWTVMIQGYAQSGHPQVALDLFGRMCVEGIEATDVTFVAVLTACAHAGMIEQGLAIASRAEIDFGVRIGIQHYHCLVDLLGRAHHLDRAEELVETMPFVPDAYSWTTLLAACSIHGRSGDDAARRAVACDPGHGAPYLKSCGAARDLARGQQLHTRIAADGQQQLHRHHFVANALVEMYGKCGNLGDARDAFASIRCPNTFSWNILIAAHIENGDTTSAVAIFNAMPERKNAITWTMMLLLYARSGDVEKSWAIFLAIADRNCGAWNAIITAYAQNGHSEESSRVWAKMPEWNVVSTTALLTGYGASGNVVRAWEMFVKMPGRDAACWNAMITANAQNRYVDNATILFNKMPLHNVVTTTMLISVLDVDSAKSTFDSMPGRNLISWNAMLTAYARAGHVLEASKMFESIPERDIVAWNSMIDAFSENGEIAKAQEVFDRMAARNAMSWTSIVAAYARKGHLALAWCRFAEMPVRNVVGWSSIIQASAHCGLYDRALELFREMVLEGVRANSVTFLGVLCGCCHGGRIAKAQQHFLSMIGDYGVAPIYEHYRCLIDALGRAKQLEQAEDLMWSMPFLPDVHAWTSLLSACRVLGDVERGSRIAKKIVELFPKDPASYLLVSNMVTYKTDL